ncbi:hypothetical protein [Robertmurraya siralis]|nr:hypothetical protein [Robertmurraya siralis]
MEIKLICPCCEEEISIEVKVPSPTHEESEAVKKVLSDNGIEFG